MRRPQFSLRSWFVPTGAIAVWAAVSADVARDEGAFGAVAVAFFLGPTLLLVYKIARGKHRSRRRRGAYRRDGLRRLQEPSCGQGRE